MGDSAHLAGYVFLCDTWSNQFHGCGMHLVTDDCSTLQLFDFLLGLGRAHLDYGLDQAHAGFFLLLYRVDAEQVEYLKLDVVAVRRQEVNLALLRHGIVADGLESLHWRRVMNTHLFCQVVYAVYASIPNNVNQVDVVTDQSLDVVIYINHTNQSFALLSEVIQESRVLTEWVISVVWEITW